MTPEMEAAAWEGLATNAAAQQHAEGNDAVAAWLLDHNQVAIDRSRLTALEQRANRDTVDATQPDLGLLAFIVRDLMIAAGYRYEPGRPLTGQAHECRELIRATRSEREHYRRDADAKLQPDPDVALSPDGRIWIKNSDGWCIFTPNGEYCESDYGDELTDAQVADWPKGRLPDRPVPPAGPGDIEVQP